MSLSSKAVLILLVVAAVVFGVAVWVNRSELNITPLGSIENESASVTPGSARTLTIPLVSQTADGQTGTATLTEVDGGTHIELQLSAGPVVGVGQPAYVISGTCLAGGEVIYSLPLVADGLSTGIIDSDFAALGNRGSLAINIRRSPADNQIVTACGEVVGL